jgi:hypothetical protein
MNDVLRMCEGCVPSPKNLRHYIAPKHRPTLRQPHLPTIMTDVCPMSERCVIFKTPADLGPAVTGSSAGDRRPVAHRLKRPCQKLRSYNSLMPPPISHTDRASFALIVHILQTSSMNRPMPGTDRPPSSGQICEFNRHRPIISRYSMKHWPILGRGLNDATICMSDM